MTVSRLHGITRLFQVIVHNNCLRRGWEVSSIRNSLRHQIADRIFADYITSGKLSVGSTLPTMRELQTQYSVSSNTILSAVSIMESWGVVESRRGSGCYVKQVQKTHPIKGNNSIGLICNSVASHLMREITIGADRICHANGYSTTVATIGLDYDEERYQVRRMVDAGCSGIVLYPVPRTYEQARNDYINTKYPDVPIVLVDLALPSQKRSQVVFDNYRLGLDMTMYLLGKGHRRIAFLDYTAGGEPRLHRSIMDRKAGHEAAMVSAGNRVDPHDCWTVSKEPHLDYTEVFVKLLRYWMEQTDRPTAVIAMEDSKAVLMQLLAQELGIRVPDQLEIVGFDDLPVGRFLRPSFATSQPDFARSGEVAMQIVLQHIRGEVVEPVTYMLPVPIVERRASILGCSNISLLKDDL